MIWTNEDVKRYVKENNVAINPLYTQMDRTGCMFCTGFKNWKSVMGKYKPAHLKLILKQKEGQNVLQECYNNEVKL
jgi:3'-phosphoadenosine 5'-phosphosulfate sulfotransferase (PAPS reductase)/FAD synthetase